LFHEYYTRKFDTIPSNIDSARSLLLNTTTKLREKSNAGFETAITQGEFHLAIKKGRKEKPGPDGISQELFQTYWEEIKMDLTNIVNDMYRKGTTLDQQKRCIIISLPKSKNATSMNDFRPITILNTDLKLLTRIIINRLRPWIPELINPGQHCGLAGMTVFDALATVRDVVAYAEYTKKTYMCNHIRLQQRL
jgi:hypothetical protein